MSEFEKKRIDREFELFTRRNFESPKRCKNLDQIRFYIQELSGKMNEFNQRFSYVPNGAYSLLTQYNTIQNKMVFQEFKNAYWENNHHLMADFRYIPSPINLRYTLMYSATANASGRMQYHKVTPGVSKERISRTEFIDAFNSHDIIALKPIQEKGAPVFQLEFYI